MINTQHNRDSLGNRYSDKNKFSSRGIVNVPQRSSGKVTFVTDNEIILASISPDCPTIEFAESIQWKDLSTSDMNLVIQAANYISLEHMLKNKKMTDFEIKRTCELIKWCSPNLNWKYIE